MRAMRPSRTPIVVLVAASLAAAAPAVSGPRDDPMRSGFAEPPAQARPRVFWQWVNGNVSAEGVRLDLAWMKRAGIGGPILFDIAFATPPVPQYVERRIGFGTPAWRETVGLAAREADRLGLSFGLHAGGGWSQTGGPWVAPEAAMKKLVWSQTLVEGGSTTVLPRPPDNNGPFQDLGVAPRFAEPRLYRDVKVLAYREGVTSPALSARAGGAAIPTEGLVDGRFSGVTTTLGPGEALDIALDAERPVFGVTLGVEGAFPEASIEVSLDGRTFTPAAKLEAAERQGLPVRTLALSGAPRARVLRFRLQPDAKAARVTEFAPRFEATVDRFEDKAGWTAMAIAPSWGEATIEGVAPATEVHDLTDRLSADGQLQWTPPPGRWRIIRLGWSLTGRRNTPASPESIGLEVDKLNAQAVARHMRAMLDPLKAQLGDLYGAKGLTYAITDSWEAGQANWTDDMIAAFKARRGYDPTPWLVVLTGRVIGDAARSDQFLWDWRRTLADLLTERHYGEIAKILHGDGLSYAAEAPGVDLPAIADGVQAKGRTDTPMGEFWVYPAGGAPLASNLADIREAASAAHVYGKPLVSAEALTTRGEDPWRTGPWQHKPIIDRFLAEGVNDLVLHTSVHQPFVDRKPGLTLRQYGQHLTRNETWAEDARGWTDYLARSAFLLRQGRAGADIAYFYGEDAPASLPWREGGRPDLPTGYDFDYLDAESLLQRLSVKDGRLVLPSGAVYAALVIPPAVDRLSLPVLRKLQRLAKAGALIVASPPRGSPTQSDTADARAWTALAARLWSGPIGAGPVGAGLAARGVAPAITGLTSSMVWTRRVLPDGELYFVANPSGAPANVQASFRIMGRAPELWNPETGEVTPATYRTVGGRTVVPLDLRTSDAVFVVFRTATRATRRVVPTPAVKTLADWSQGWRVTFAPGWGPEQPRDIAALSSWTEDADPLVKYFSGAATYAKTITVPAEWRRAGDRLVLELGEVRELATVTLNGKTLRTLWRPPFSIDVTDALKNGENRLEVRVVNYWSNRMIGDLQPGTPPRTFASIAPFTAASPLSPAGLLGPVRLERVAPEASTNSSGVRP